jgi:hypothetical protein
VKRKNDKCTHESPDEPQGGYSPAVCPLSMLGGLVAVADTVGVEEDHLEGEDSAVHHSKDRCAEAGGRAPVAAVDGAEEEDGEGWRASAEVKRRKRYRRR